MVLCVDKYIILSRQSSNQAQYGIVEMRNTTHHQAPGIDSVRLVLVYKNFGAMKGISHIGLGVAARNTAATLRKNGFRVEIWPISAVPGKTESQVLVEKINSTQKQAVLTGEHPVSHIVISAPWLPTKTLQELSMTFTEIVFSVSCHSNVSFLQVDPSGMKLLRDTYELSLSNFNFKAAGNCLKYTNWVERSYNINCSFLPNLYDLSVVNSHCRKATQQSGAVRIGCFCATRQLKNISAAVAAAIGISNSLNKDVEIWVSAGRDTNNAITSTIDSMVGGLPRVELIRNNWQSWPAFRTTIASMDLLLQPSFTETFNIVTADGIAEGVASVTSPTIDWVPPEWHAEPDDVNDIIAKGVGLLNDNYAPKRGLEFLTRYVQDGIMQWSNFLLSPN